MSFFKEFWVLGFVLFSASCSTPAAFPDISDEVGGVNKSDGLVSAGARRASIPEEEPEEKAAHEKKEAVLKARSVSEETKKAEAAKKVEKPKAAKSVQQKKETADEDVKLISNEEFLSRAEELEAVRTKPVLKADKKYASDSESDKNRYAKIYDGVSVASQKPELPQIPKEEKVPSVTYRLETFYFDNGGASLSGEDFDKIRRIVRTAKENNAKIKVAGYASSRTRNTDIATHKLMNFRVSQARADAVAKALVRAGMQADDITVEALSDSNPAYLEVMPEGERLNRRAEVYISY